MTTRHRAARPGDIQDIARRMPFTVEDPGSNGRPVFQVGGKSFVFFRNARPDAVDGSGRRLEDVVVIWVQSDADKQSLVQDGSPFFTTPHFNGHPSVLLRESDVGRLGLDELTEVIQDAWLARASSRRAKDWLHDHAR